MDYDQYFSLHAVLYYDTTSSVQGPIISNFLLMLPVRLEVPGLLLLTIQLEGLPQLL